MTEAPALPATVEPMALAVPTPVTAAVIERERAELETACTMAARFPRQRVSVDEACLAMCETPALARPKGGAWYAFPRGGKTITGPTVKLARAMAARWGHVSSGVRVLARTEEHVHIEAFAHDRQTGVRFSFEDFFPILVQRKQGKGPDAVTVMVVPDERDTRGLIARRGAYLERNCLLKLMPPELVEACMDAARRAAGRQIAKTLEVERVETLRAWKAMGISKARLEERLGCSLEETSGDQLAEMEALYMGIASKETTLAAVFPPKSAEVDEGKVTAGAPPAARE